MSKPYVYDPEDPVEDFTPLPFEDKNIDDVEEDSDGDA